MRVQVESIKNLENRIEQLDKLIQERIPGAFYQVLLWLTREILFKLLLLGVFGSRIPFCSYF